MAMAVDLLSWALILFGGLFMVIGAVGVVRLPDFYARLHGAGLTDTMAATLIVAGLMLQGGWSLVSLKLFLMLFLLYFTSPTASHALANAAFHAGLRPKGSARTELDRRPPSNS